MFDKENQVVSISKKRIFLFLVFLCIFAVFVLSKFALTAWGYQGGSSVSDMITERGPILDRNGRVLAVQTMRYNLCVTLASVSDPEELKNLIAPVVEMTPEEILQKAFPGRKTVQGLFKFGKEKNLTVGIVSGGAAEDVYQAIDQGLDIYITGESSHEIYHPCQENKINFLAAGHYETETGGVKNAAAKLGLDTGIETVFIDIPTNQ